LTASYSPTAWSSSGPPDEALREGVALGSARWPRYMLPALSIAFHPPPSFLGEGGAVVLQPPRSFDAQARPYRAPEQVRGKRAEQRSDIFSFGAGSRHARGIARRYVTYCAVGRDGPRTLWLRSLDASHAQVSPLSGGALAPFWAPDSRSIGFFAPSLDAVRKMQISADGTPKVIPIHLPGRNRCGRRLVEQRRHHSVCGGFRRQPV